MDVDVSTLDLTQYYYLGLSPKAGAEYANAIMLRCNNLRGGYVDQENTRDRTFFRFFMDRQSSFFDRFASKSDLIWHKQPVFPPKFRLINTA